MKIAQVVCILPPKAGGIGRAAHCFSKELAARGHDVIVFTPSVDIDLAAGKNYSVVSLKPAARIGLGAILPQLFWRLRNFDVVHLHYPFFGSALLTALAVRLFTRKARLIVSYHMDVELSGWQNFYEKATRLLFLNFILNSADKIVCSTFDYIENSVIKKYYFAHREKFVEIPFGADGSFIPMKKDPELLAHYGFVDSDKIVLFVGGLNAAHYFKGIDYLIEALSLIRNEKIKALIVGSGNLKKKYERLVEERGLAGRVKFAGYVDDALLPKHYNLADAAVLPSINSSEAFGIVLVEAMACGKPVLASNLPGVRAVVVGGRNGLVFVAKNSADIAEKIVELFGDEERYALFAKNCLEVVEEKYRWSVIVDKIEAMFVKKL